jgi:hypothetical protein
MPVGPAPAIKTGFKFSFIGFLQRFTERATALPKRSQGLWPRNWLAT